MHRNRFSSGVHVKSLPALANNTNNHVIACTIVADKKPESKAPAKKHESSTLRKSTIERLFPNVKASVEEKDYICIKYVIDDQEVTLKLKGRKSLHVSHKYFELAHHLLTDVMWQDYPIGFIQNTEIIDLPMKVATAIFRKNLAIDDFYMKCFKKSRDLENHLYDQSQKNDPIIHHKILQKCLILLINEMKETSKDHQEVVNSITLPSIRF